ncbi:MAG: hypothetical protein IPG87_04985 [Saprospiraceae bacterium]|nr:hypothetical protein [Candidatus Vicinibacter affinis]
MLVYSIFRIILFFFRILPFRGLHFLADLVYIFLLYIIKYRRRVIEENLLACFPNMSEIERYSLVKKTYRNLADILIEGIKGLLLSKEEIFSRNTFIKASIVNEYLEKGQSVICVCGHYNNWEWTVLGIGYHFQNKAIGIYKKISNSYVEKYIKQLRAKSSMLLLPTSETRKMVDEIPKGKLILLMADQNPSNVRDAIWVKFFNKETACLHGLEKYSKTYNLPVIYMGMERVKRSLYTLEFTLLVENPAACKYGEITQRFMSMLEKTIIDDPSNWLWSHKRWKHTRSLNQL